MDERAQKLKSGLQLLKVVRSMFLLGGFAFALASIVVAFKQFDGGNIGQDLTTALAGILFGVAFGVGAWFVISCFMQSAQDHSVKIYGPQFEKDLTGQTDHWNEKAVQTETSSAEESSTSQLDLEVDLTASVMIGDVEETLTLTAAHLFTQDDLRGNVDLVVAASPANSPDILTEGLLQRLQLGFDGRETRLETLGHQPNDPNGSFLVVLCYSATDLIGEFDRPQLERWIDELAASLGMVSVFWDNQLLGTVRLMVAD